MIFKWVLFDDFHSMLLQELILFSALSNYQLFNLQYFLILLRGTITAAAPERNRKRGTCSLDCLPFQCKDEPMHLPWYRNKLNTSNTK